MKKNIQGRINSEYQRLNSRYLAREEEIQREVESLRKSKMLELQLRKNKLDTYLRHLEYVFSLVVKENNPFTIHQLEHTANPLKTVHSAIKYLGSEYDEEESGNRLLVEDEFCVGNLEKLANLRNNTQIDLLRLLQNTSMYAPVALGFVEISAVELKKNEQIIQSAQAYIDSHKNVSGLKKLLGFTIYKYAKEITNPQREISLPYELTPLGETALSVPTEIVAQAEFENIFEDSH